MCRSELRGKNLDIILCEHSLLGHNMIVKIFVEIVDFQQKVRAASCKVKFTSSFGEKKKVETSPNQNPAIHRTLVVEN
jgi:hypothetical protein